jgi:putative MATE family efflux protein
MAAKEIDMTTGSLWKKIIIFSLPLVASNLLQILFNISDIAVVGKFVGENALGSVGSTTILVVLFTGFLIGLGNGVNVVVAKYIGAKDKENVKATVMTSFLVSLIYGIIFYIISEGVTKLILEVLGTKDDLIDGALIYSRIYFIGLPGLALFNYGNALYSANGNTKRPLIILTTAGIVNVGLNFLFVLVFKLEIIGVSLASVISQYLSALLIIISLMRDRSDISLTFKNYHLDKSKAYEVLKIGVPTGFQNAIFAIANLFIQSGINKFDTTTVNGISAATNADNIIYDSLAAVYMACAAFISQNYGAKNKERILKTYYISLIYSVSLGIILGGLLIIFDRQFLSIFANDEQVIQAGIQRIKIMGISYWISAFMDCSIAASRGLGKTFWPTIFLISGCCFFRIIWLYTFFNYFKTIESLFLLYACSWIITSIAEISYFIVAYKKFAKNDVIIKNKTNVPN